MSNRAHIVSHAHASATNPDGPKSTTISDTNTTAHTSRKCSSKSPEPKRKEDIFLERYRLLDSMKASEEMKITLLMSMQKKMEKLVDKF